MKIGWSVYIHISPSNKYYIGVTSRQPEDRWRNGFGYYSQPFYNAIMKYGWDNIYHEVIAENLTEDEAFNFEKVLIKKIKSNNRKYGYNITSGGDKGYSHKHTDEWCEQHSRDMTGKGNPMYGKKHSKETLKRISQARTGKCVGEDNPFYGRSHSKETIRRILKSRSWYKPSRETVERISNSNKKPVLQFDCETGDVIRIFSSIKDAATELNLDRGSITKCCQHKRKTVGGYRWEYKNTSVPVDF